MRTHAHTRSHTCTHAAAVASSSPYRLSLFGGAQPTVTGHSACDNAGRWPFKSKHGLATRFTRGFGSFSRIKKLLGRTETRTRDRMYCQTIRIVRDSSRDDRARIATCRLRTLTDRLKENFSIDFSNISTKSEQNIEVCHIVFVAVLYWRVLSLSTNLKRIDRHIGPIGLQVETNHYHYHSIAIGASGVQLLIFVLYDSVPTT